MTKDQFRWTPYNEILHTLPHCCTIDEPLWMAYVPMLCLEIVEVHAPDRVMRQFGRPQHIPMIPSWGTNHHVHDQRRRLGSEVLEMLDKYFRDWGNRHQSLAVEVDDGTRGAGYKLWYMRYGRLLIGKPALEVDVPSDFVHSAGTSIAMSRGLFKLHSLALQWQRDTTLASHGEEGTSGTAHCDTEDTALYNTQDFIEGLLDDPIESQIHTTGPSSIVEESPTTIIEDVVPTINEDPDVTQIHTTGPSSTVEESPTTIIEDVVPTVNEDPDVTQTTLSPLSSPDVTFIMPVDDMPQTPERKKVVKRIVKNVNIKDLPAKKRKRDNEDEDGYTGLRPRDVLRISRKSCGT
ncbi:hypothetical protein KY285_025569 [Solanum tuberosum]|nr:hypothetical protein KY285_025569 [Solanum tuberosum]